MGFSARLFNAARCRIAAVLGAALILGITSAALAGAPVCAVAETAAYSVGVGDTTTVTTSLSFDSATQHVDYAVTSGSEYASVNKHKGTVTGKAAGEAVVTAYIINKPRISGQGTGDDSLCGEYVASEQIAVTVGGATQEYGLQGTGGLNIKMLQPAVGSVSGNDTDGYTNVIKDTMVASEKGIVTFTYSQDGALNNGLDTYLANSAQSICVKSADGSTVLAQLASSGNLTASIDAANSAVTLSFDVSALGDANAGILVLGKGIKNNNGNKTVGVDLMFPFTVDKSDVKPQQPDTPTEPDTPSQPDTPTEPDTPSQPDTPTEPDTPSDADDGGDVVLDLPAKAVLSSATSKAAGKITVSWKKVAKATGYQVAYKVAGGKWLYKKCSKLTLTLSKLKKGKKYTVKVRAFNSAGNGSWSASKQVKVKK